MSIVPHLHQLCINKVGDKITILLLVVTEIDDSLRATRATRSNSSGDGSNVLPIPDFGKSTKIEKTGKIGKV